MESNLKFWLIYFILAVAEVKCNNIVQINGDVSVTPSDDGKIYTLAMNENNHDFDGVEEIHIPLFKIIDVNSEPTITFIQSASFRHSIEQVVGESTSYILYSNQSFDYETQARTYSFNIFINGEAPVVTLNIINIDDEPPSLTPPQCEFEENTIFTVENSKCTCTVSDPDGWLSQMNFSIVKDDRFNADQIFELKYKEIPADNIYTADVYVTVKEELNYQAVTFYLFDIRAKDGAGHATTPNELVRGLVNVIDLPDTPPEWTSFFTTAQFEEQSEQTFSVTAIDGDYGLNYEINYSKLWEDDEEADYISIDNNGTIKVNKIDRDKDDISTYNFEIMAFEVPNQPIWNNTLNITFYIIDIDNNPPLIRWVDDAANQNISFDDVTDKSIQLSFLENYAGNLNRTIFIKDIDTGENAQFTVELEDLEDNDIAYTEAFLIVPSAGYRSGQFQITVRNATYLDYEVPEWVHITFNVLTIGTLDPEKQDRMLVDISLIDYNDEYPIFNESEYTVEILETAKKGDSITTLLATDRDAEDKILTHSLIGSSYTNRVLDIIPETGEIFVSADNAFDYDTVNPIFVQVRATDKVLHNATVPLTINLLDVNNKAPTILVGDPINVDENQNSSTKLNATITASDMDTTANLSATIDWENSYAMKNSRRLDMDNVTISQQVIFLNAEYERVDSEDETNKDIKIYLVVNDNNPDETTPDFELFDSLYISLKVTDWNTDPEFMDNQNTSTLILISINDINDNTPFFPEADPDAEPVNRTVQEAVATGTSVGSIVAIDYDVGDTVTYDCQPDDLKFDWVQVDTDTGAFTVKSDSIDADTYKTYYFNYTCTASDNGFTHTSEPLKVRFYIIDTNNRIPTIITNLDDVSVDEKSPASTEVKKIETSDLDRDIPFHTVECTFDRGTSCADQFLIEDNVIRVKNGGDEIDRDEGDETYTCPMTCTDNPHMLQNDRNPNSVAKTFTITLNDINDHWPVVLTEDLSNSESLNKGEIIGIIIATDIDKGDNAEIDFKVSKVVDSNDQEIDDIFGTETDEHYFVDLTHKQANLVALQDLKGLYGTYTVTIWASDRGNPPKANYTDITVEIEKFNFESPRFVFPSASGTSFILLLSQQPFSQLILYRSQEESPYLDDFYASDNSATDICNKWDVTIEFEQISPKDDTIFLMSKSAECAGQLQVNNRFESTVTLGQRYELKLIARVRDGEPLDGEEPYTTETNIIVNFMDNDQQPIFDCSNMVFTFREELMDQTQPLDCPAEYIVPDDTLERFYYLDSQSADQTVLDTFKIDLMTGDISLKQKISYKQNEQLQFSVVASNSLTPSSYNQMSYLNVTCNVIEINNNWPQWIRKSFFGAIMSGYNRNTIVVTVEATDADKIDQGHLRYYINGSVNIHGTGLSNLPSEPFNISNTLGEIRLNFQVDSTMSGYFQFEVTVWDQEDEFGNGPHWNTTDVTIFIITSDNTVDFRFYNSVDEVQKKEDDMLTVISEVLSYNAYKQNIDEDHESNEEMTIASLYFVNDTVVQAMPAATILRSISNINVYSQLVSELRNRTGLILMSFPSNNSASENLEEVLKAWLVGVSVVLGALCLILLVTFILKTRQLNNRIKNLTTNKFGSQESDLNRLGISAPTTNKHAIEGSNPIFNLNKDDLKRDMDKYDEFDGHSIRSGDSDLIGIEDNPEFDYHHDNRSQHI